MQKNKDLVCVVVVHHAFETEVNFKNMNKSVNNV